MIVLFDPVVFENLKVALENQLYDFDNLDQVISIVDRKDKIDMASMSRYWSLAFELVKRKPACPLKAEIVLTSSIEDLADEILERDGTNPGCYLTLRFMCTVEDPRATCPKIEALLESIWGNDVISQQHLSASFGCAIKQVEENHIWAPLYFENEIELPFNRKINEEQMEDLEPLIEHAIKTLDGLVNILL